ncbi:hypothetical protein BC938DRAFT_471107 [Jimgerdemannia flammicorona]|uniref:SAM domain-containing protein n=1 Tax=Jimgerdemannia flammicorona TaxID=994334 RepID=A0A433Q8W1_9FUNG|nr:hypothetical protein BC938DRAFT_471107 [Jimgerdemannia flammicorona]
MSSPTETHGDEIEASTSSSKAAQPLTTDGINKWNTDQVIQHLQAKFPGDFDNEDLEVLQKRKIRGRAFLKLTEEKLMTHGMEPGQAIQHLSDAY